MNEGGDGDLRLTLVRTRSEKNGADSVEIDEYNDGSIFGTVVGSAATHNFEEGFDFNENNAGDLRVDMTGVEASWNREEGIDFEDDDFDGGGDVVTVMRDIKTFGNGDGADGALKIREKEAGNLTVTLSNIVSTHNVGSGVFVRESSGGNAVVQIENVRSLGMT